MSTRPFTRHYACRLSDDLVYRGQPLVVMENELVRIAVAPEKGAEILSFVYKPADVDPLLHRSGGLQPPVRYPATIPNADGAFLDSYTGGWQEIFPSGGGPCQVAGADLGRHGEAALLPWKWEVTADRAECVEVRFQVTTLRMPFLLERTMRLQAGQATVKIDEKVVNQSGEELPFMWGHHPAFGVPFLDESCVLDTPARRVKVHAGSPDPEHQRLSPDSCGEWPVMPGSNGAPVDLRQIPPPGSHTADMFYLTGLAAGWYALTNRRLGVGFALTWPVDVFPVLWVWQEFCASAGYPWYRSLNALGLEPFTGYSTADKAGLAEVIRARRERRLPPGGTLSASLRAMFYAGEGIQGVANISPGGEIELR